MKKRTYHDPQHKVIHTPVTFVKVVFIVSTAILLFPCNSFSLSGFENVDQSLLYMESHANDAFLLFSNGVSDVSRTNTSTVVTDTDISLTANFTFMVDGVSYSGPGTWHSTETGDTIDFDFHFALSNGSQVLYIDYDGVGSLSNNTLTETYSYAMGAQYLSTQKTSRITETDTTKTTQASATSNINGHQYALSARIDETIISSQSSRFSATFEGTPSDPTEPATRVEAEYELVYNPGEKTTATFTKYDVTIDDVLTYVLGDGTTRCEVLDHAENSYSVSCFLELSSVVVGVSDIRYNVFSHTRISGELFAKSGKSDDESWWSGREAAENAASAMTGTMAGTSSFAILRFFGWPAHLAGLVAAGVGGVVMYTYDAWLRKHNSESKKAASEIGENKVKTTISPSIPALATGHKILLVLLLFLIGIAHLRKRNSGRSFETPSPPSILIAG